MRKFRKKVFLFLLTVMSAFITLTFTVNAESDNLFEQKANESAIYSQVDMSNLEVGEKYSKRIVLANGEEGIISIEKVSNLLDEQNSTGIVPYAWNTWQLRSNVTDGVYHVNVVAIGVTIVVRNYNITEAYGAWHIIPVVNTTGKLTPDSPKQAT